MSDFLGIDLIAGLNQEKTKEEINSTIRKLNKSSDLEKLQVELKIDEKVLDTIREFNREIKNLSTLYSKANQQIKQLLPSSEINKTTKDIQTLHKTVDKLGKSAEVKSKKAIDSNEKEARSVRNLEREYRQLDETGKLIGAKEVFKDDRGIGTVTKKYTIDEDGKHLTGEQQVTNYGAIKKAIAKDNKEIARLTKEREALFNRLANVHMRYGGDSKKIESFQQKIALADLGDLKRVRENIAQYETDLRKINQLRKAQQDAQMKAKRLADSIHGTMSPEHQSVLNNYLISMNKLTSSTPNLSGKIQELNNQFNKLSHEAIKADSGMARFQRQLASAIVRVPIYAAVMSGLYAPIKMFRSAIQQSIEIDSQMTVLERVSNGTIKMNEALESSIDIAGRLGNVISEVNDGLISFARQGYRGDELENITEVATLMSNVSDLTVDDSASSITAAMKGFNIEAEKSIHIVNAMNEVDNNYAVTTQQLAESVQRSAGAANTYGSTLERTIGYTTGITEVTRESGSVIGNSLKTIFSRITSIPEAVEGLNEIGIAVKNSSGEMRDVDDILDDLGSKWKTLSKEQQQNLGIGIAG